MWNDNDDYIIISKGISDRYCHFKKWWWRHDGLAVTVIDSYFLHLPTKLGKSTLILKYNPTFNLEFVFFRGALVVPVAVVVSHCITKMGTLSFNGKLIHFSPPMTKFVFLIWRLGSLDVLRWIMAFTEAAYDSKTVKTSTVYECPLKASSLSRQ